MQRTGAGDPARLDLPALGQERRQQADVLVVDVVDLLGAELTDAPAPGEKRGDQDMDDDRDGMEVQR